jgi:hypothetical protein
MIRRRTFLGMLVLGLFPSVRLLRSQENPGGKKMRKLRLVSLAAVCMLSVGAWAQGAPYVVVSTTAGSILKIDTSNGLANARSPLTLVANPGAEYSLVIGPDNSGGLANAVLVYACDRLSGTVTRFNPSNFPSQGGTNETVYAGIPSQQVRCGRITASGPANGQNGDLVVSTSGGLLVFPAITYKALGTLGAANKQPSSTNPNTQSGGIAQKNSGDLLAVNSAGNAVLRTVAPAPNFDAPGITPIGNISLSQPLGIARRSDGVFFVSNQGGTPNVTYFSVNSQNNAAGTGNCEVFSGNNKGVPAHMQISLDDILYVAVANGTKGIIQSLNASVVPGSKQVCDPKLTQTFGLSAPAVGIALPPTSVSLNIPGNAAANGNFLLNFGFAGFEVSNIAPNFGCQGSVNVSLVNPAFVAGLISTQLAGPGVPAINLALDGFQAVVNTKNVVNDPNNLDPNSNAGCTALDGLTMNFQVAHQLAHSVTDPKVMVCQDDDTNCSIDAGLPVLKQIGTWPVNGYLPDDITTGGRKTLKCNVYMIQSLPTGVPPEEDGTFCGFQSPITNTFLNAAPATLSAGKSVPIKFKLSPSGPNSCQSAPYITDATAILSVAQIADSKGKAMFIPIGLISNGSSGLGQPLFKGDKNQQYLFNWDTSSCIMPNGTRTVCPKGTYSLTVVFLTNNTANTNPSQNIYTDLTTQVVLK